MSSLAAVGRIAPPQPENEMVASLILQHGFENRHIDQIRQQIGHVDVTVIKLVPSTDLSSKLKVGQIHHDYNSERLSDGARKPVAFIHEGDCYVVHATSTRTEIVLPLDALDTLFNRSTSDVLAEKIAGLPPEFRELYKGLPEYFKSYVARNTPPNAKMLDSEILKVASEAYKIVEYIVGRAGDSPVDSFFRDWVKSIKDPFGVPEVILMTSNRFEKIQLTTLAQKYMRQMEMFRR